MTTEFHAMALESEIPCPTTREAAAMRNPHTAAIEQPPLAATREKSPAMKTQHSQKKKKKTTILIKKKKHRDVERIFGEASGDLYEFARQSQISQAEAKKYFIESFRAKKWRRTGILWWNVIDGWPQVSDAIIDWYGTKKLAYGYIKRSQAPLCLLFDEPKDGKITLIAANDSRACESVEYKVTNLVNDEVVLSGKVDVEKDGKIEVDSLVEEKNAFYLIEWKYSLGEGKNHFVTTIGDNWTYDKYKACMIKAGFYDEFEGFDK